MTTTQPHSTEPELRFCAGSNLPPSMWKICPGENLWLWSRVEIRFNAFRWPTIPQKQFIIIIIIIIIIMHACFHVVFFIYVDTTLNSINVRNDMKHEIYDKFINY